MRFLLTALFAVLLPNLAHADCLSDFNAMIHGTAAAGAYRVDSHATFTEAGVTRELNNELHVRLPDSLVLIMNNGFPGAMSSQANTERQVIAIINGKGQLRKGDSGWTPLPDEAVQGMLQAMRENGFAMGAIASPECLGTKVHDGKEMTTYRFLANGIPMTMYVDRKSGLPAFVEGGTKVGETTHGSLTMTYSYGDTVKIELPK